MEEINKINTSFYKNTNANVQLGAGTVMRERENFKKLGELLHNASSIKLYDKNNNGKLDDKEHLLITDNARNQIIIYNPKKNEKSVNIYNHLKSSYNIDNINNVDYLDFLKVNIKKAEIKSVPTQVTENKKFEIKIPKKYQNNAELKSFVNSLETNKDNIIRELGITPAEYEQLAYVAIGIAQEETNFGKNRQFGDKNPKIAALFRGDDRVSRGFTNLKINDIKGIEWEHMEKLGVTRGSNQETNITEPKFSAIATVIHLNTLKSKYTKYVNNIGKYQKNMLTSDEYIAATWKGLRLDTTNKSTKIKNQATVVMEKILADRIANVRSSYVGKVLENGKNFKADVAK